MASYRNLAKSIAIAIAGLSAQFALADSISPTTYSDIITVGGTTTVNKTVTVNKEVTTSKLDIFFLADTTGSMGSALTSVKTNAVSLLASSGALGDVRWAVGEYKDTVDAFAYKLDQDFTSNTAAVTAGINSWSAGGGGDLPEADLFGLQSAADDASWRTGAGHVLVWFGDAIGHDPSLGATEATATAALVAKGIKVEAVNNGDLDGSGQASRITAATGGALFPSSGAGVAAAIASAIESAVSNYNKVCLDASETPGGLSAMPTACITGSFDRSIDRTFGFSLSFTGMTPGDYTFNTYGTVDGGRVATEVDHIIVTNDGTVPEPGSLALISLGLLGAAGISRRKPKSSK